MTNQPNNTPTRRIYSVSEFSQSLSTEIADKFPSVCVRGEVTNLSKPRSGHWYFSLKDDNSELRTVMFRSSNLKAHQIKEGEEIIVCGKPSIYKGRGDLQLVASYIQLSGAGDLQKKFDELKKELLSKGYFDSSRKQEIPLLPNKIAVITSPSGAVIQDIKTIMARRAPMLPILLIPSVVQGTQAISDITKALSIADKNNDIDLIILARGGGSLEDFSAFNSREVAMAIADSKTPIISSVGHETDFSISDMVADLRAATPSEAAEIASQGYTEIKDKIKKYERSFSNTVRQHLLIKETQLRQLQNQLKSPRHRLEQVMQKLDFLEPLLESRIRLALNKKQSSLSTLSQKINPELLQNQKTQKAHRLLSSSNKLSVLQEKILGKKRERFLTSLRTLDAISPLAVLSRGYGISTNQNKEVILSTKELTIGEKITTKVCEGEFTSKVIDIKK